MNIRRTLFLLLWIAGLSIASALSYNMVYRPVERKAVPQPESLADTTRFPVRPTSTRQVWKTEVKNMDLHDPKNMERGLVFDENTGHYYYGTKIGKQWVTTPFYLTSKDVAHLDNQRIRTHFFKKKNAELAATKGKDKFDFTDMHFDLGPAERIFGPGGVRIRTQGSLELKLGANTRKIDNPSLSERNRKTFGFDFDEKVNLNVNAKVGDKMGMDFNYNSHATFNFDAQKLKLRFEGKEDDILQLVEAGNVSMPTNNSLVRGAHSLFGLRTDFQLGKLKFSTVLAQKKSNTQTVKSEGGVQMQNYAFSADNYDENRHFFLSHYFYDTYDNNMSQLPNVLSGITIKRVEIWVTNNTGQTNNTRNIVGFTDLGEAQHISSPLWHGGDEKLPANNANDLYSTLTQSLQGARNISTTTQVLDAYGLKGGKDYEKLESARLLNSNEYQLNKSLGYVSLLSTLQTDQVLAVAFEYTYRGKNYQVGEFSTDLTQPSEALFVKSLKNTANIPAQGNWRLMMKNVYSLGAMDVQKERFRLNIKYLSDSAGVQINYLPLPRLKEKPIIQLLGLDRLDNNNRRHPNGYYDYVAGYTIDAQNGRVFFTSVEPFGKCLRKAIGNKRLADRFAYDELYDSTKTVARQIAEKNKYFIEGQLKASRNNEIYLGAMNIPRGSVIVTAGGVTLSEGSDYTVDYYGGTVTIINQSILDAGTPVNVSLESDTQYGMQRKTMFGLNWEYTFSKQLLLGGTFMHLGEKPLTTKTALGGEALNNTLWGMHLRYETKSQWLTDMLDKLPLLRLTEPSSLRFNAEFAQLIAGKNKYTQGNASYLDDFENASGDIDISNPKDWTISSTPSMFPESQLSNDKRYGENRALLAWYYIDPLFTRRSSSYTPAHIKNDVEQLSDPDVREIYKTELFPNKSFSTQESMTLNVLNLAYYPNERGPYNLSRELDRKGQLLHPEKRWGGMMRAINAPDFEAANVEYIEFWMMDPFIKARKEGRTFSGNLYFDLGEISEDILKDGKKMFESGLPADGNKALYTETYWGRVPNQMSVTYAFSTAEGARSKQDVGFNGLSSEEEANATLYRNYLDDVKAIVDGDIYAKWAASPSGDKYHYFRGSDYDEAQTPILDRYKYINNPNGNSSDAKNSGERYSTAYKNTPDVEDANRDYTLNEYERYYQYHVHIAPEEMKVGRNYIVDAHRSVQKLRNGKKEECTWYLFRIPIRHYEKSVGGISGFNSIRFMRMFMTDFASPAVLRLATLNLVRGDWRTYEQRLYNNSSEGHGTLEAGTVNFEENNDKTPVNYVLPPGITREVEPGNRELLENNEQALSLVVRNLSSGAGRAVYKNMSLDLRRYKHLQMFTHANSLIGSKEVEDGDVSVFLRLGTDYQSNYYEYEIPLTITPAGHYTNNQNGAQLVWPEANMLDIDLRLLTNVKALRNKQKALGLCALNELFEMFDPQHQKNKVSVMGNPTLGDIRTIMIGVRNNARETENVEVWCNELRLQDMTNKGGWAAQASLNLQLSDLASVDMSGHIETDGFGGIEEGVMERRDNTLKEYSVTTNVQLGKMLPEKAKLEAPLYFSYSKQQVEPQYNPLDSDMPIEDAYAAMATQHEIDSLKNIANKVVIHRNLSLSGVRFNVSSKRPMPYDPANFVFGYAHGSTHTTGATTAWEKNQSWQWNLGYNYSPRFKPFYPFKKIIKSSSKWWQLLKKFGIHYAPENVAFTSDIARNYYEMQERDMQDLNDSSIPLVWSSDFFWKRSFTLRWNLTDRLQMSFNSGTDAEVLQPYTAVNKDLYPDRYTAWKDSVWQSIRSFGEPLDYRQNVGVDWRVPIELIPAFDWVNMQTSYRSSYNWQRGTRLEDGTSMGNTINMGRELTANTRLNMETLYNHVPFLKKVNQKFSGRNKSRSALKKKNKKKYEKEVQLLADTTVMLAHGQNTKHPRIKALKANGERMRLKYKVVDKNRVLILTQDTVKVKVTVLAPPPIDNKGWYKALQYTARGLMALRNVSVNYTEKFNMSLPGFMPDVGDFFGQASGMQPGMDFALGLTDERYLDKAAGKGWLLESDSVITPATTSRVEDWQIRATLEPLKDLKIDLTAVRNVNRAKSIQYMFEGMPTTESGAFTQTTISIGSAFEKIGNADEGYHSSRFEAFRSALPRIRAQVEARYAGVHYPEGTILAGQVFDAKNGGVNPYSAEVMIPAFLQSYTSGSDGLKLLPTMRKLLPNWTITYRGLSRLRRMKKVFKTFSIRHGYKSIFSVGGYNSFTTYLEAMEGVGFVNDVTTGLPTPSGAFDISAVSINESFSPLIGVDMSFHNNMTAKLELRKSRVLTLSMTNQQINEAHSNDIVVGMGYRIDDFKPFAGRGSKRKGKRSHKKGKSNSRSRFKNTLNLRLNVSLRDQTALNRDIVAGITQATGGNKATQVSFTADYALSKMLTLTGFYERQMNRPLLTSSSYPTTTQNFGVSFKIRLNH